MTKMPPHACKFSAPKYRPSHIASQSVGKLTEIAYFLGQLSKNEWEENYKICDSRKCTLKMKIFTSFPVDQNPTPPAYSGEIY